MHNSQSHTSPARDGMAWWLSQSISHKHLPSEPHAAVLPPSLTYRHLWNKMTSTTNDASCVSNAELGFLYVITHDNAMGMVKIGITQRPQAGMDELGAADIYARVLCYEPRKHEQRLHAKYSDRRVPGTEWFRFDPGRQGQRGDPEFGELLEEVYAIGEEVLSLCIHHPNMPLPVHLAWIKGMNHSQRMYSASQDSTKIAAEEIEAREIAIFEKVGKDSRITFDFF